LIKANFQAMRYYDPSLVLDAGSYEAMLGRFSDRLYHLDSRHTADDPPCRFPSGHDAQSEKRLTASA
jgi:hypothetical protein